MALSIASRGVVPSPFHIPLCSGSAEARDVDSPCFHGTEKPCSISQSRRSVSVTVLPPVVVGCAWDHAMWWCAVYCLPLRRLDHAATVHARVAYLRAVQLLRSPLGQTAVAHDGNRGDRQAHQPHDAISSRIARASARAIGIATPLPIILRLACIVHGWCSSQSGGRPCSRHISARSRRGGL